MHEGRQLAEWAIIEDRAIEKFRTLVEAQGGDVAYVDDPDKFPKAKHIEVVESPESGYLEQVQARDHRGSGCGPGGGSGKERRSRRPCGRVCHPSQGRATGSKKASRCSQSMPMTRVCWRSAPGRFGCHSLERCASSGITFVLRLNMAYSLALKLRIGHTYKRRACFLKDHYKEVSISPI
jgi:hypothetical protein